MQKKIYNVEFSVQSWATFPVYAENEEEAKRKAVIMTNAGRGIAELEPNGDYGYEVADCYEVEAVKGDENDRTAKENEGEYEEAVEELQS